ncbi:DNA primase family protein [Ralstonia chuxiongensis]|uniref:DNA primase family protein n=1 Tax=Ralstonia chuxiongensis TaxID=2957504 RepID=UPI0028F53E11|nr:phage/plasmid primase, P4 family [Ralstonia chuxiongensis]CAJ0776287.1 hypothetical protein R8510_04223 [Ralstonia chuxiongensis]
MSDIPLKTNDLAFAPAAIEFCAFRSSSDIVPTRHRLTIPQFVERFSKPPVLAAKGGPAWSPTIYPEGVNRSKNGVVAVTALVMDVDDGTPIEEFHKRLNGYAYFWHTSYSHTPERPKYRIVVFLAAPVPANQWGELWLRAQAWMEGHLDPATKDASRMYYLPSMPPGAQGHDRGFVQGVLLDMTTLPPLSQAPARNEVVVIEGRSMRTVSAANREGNEAGDAGQSGLSEVLKRCHAIRDIAAPENQAVVPEPLWRAMLSNVGRFAGGLAFAHAASQHHPNYDEGEVDNRLARHVAESGPITCAEIQRCGYTSCPGGGCVLPSGEATKAPAGLIAWPVRFTAKDIPHPIILRSFLDACFKEGLVFANSEFHRYRAGAWEQLDKVAEVDQKLLEFLGNAATSQFVKQLSELLVMRQAKATDEFAPDLHHLCLLNGTLNLNSFELEPHSPKHRLRTRLNIAWQPEALAPKWMAYLDSIFQPDPDKAEKIAFLQEWMGYLLVPDTKMHKMLWLVGSGANGKSVLLSVVEALVGKANISNAMLDSFHLSYVRAELDGKLVNVAGEMAADAMINDGFIKAIVAGDTIEAARKYKPSFSFKPFVRLMAATNNLPRTNDLTHGFSRRAIILTFNRQFATREQNPNLVKELVEELPGILAWAVEGLRRLRAQQNLTIPPSSETAVAAYMADANPVQLFANECLVKAPNGRGIRTKDIYPLYNQWCRRYGYQPRNDVTFSKALKGLGFEQKKVTGYMHWKVAVTSDARDYTTFNADLSYDTGTSPANDSAEATTTARVSRLASKYSV